MSTLCALWTEVCAGPLVANQRLRRSVVGPGCLFRWVAGAGVIGVSWRAETAVVTSRKNVAASVWAGWPCDGGPVSWPVSSDPWAWSASCESPCWSGPVGEAPDMGSCTLGPLAYAGLTSISVATTGSQPIAWAPSGGKC